MSRRVSAKTAVRDAKRSEVTALKEITKITTHDGGGVSTADSFINLAHKLGVGADSPLSSGTYGFNPITRNRTLLEWIHRGSWLGGVAVDVVADDMTRSGIEFKTELSPDDSEKIDEAVTALGIWDSINDAIRWGRLYGGGIAVALVDGQDPRTPLRVETIGPLQFRGLLTLDRWMVEPSVEDLVTEMGPHLGLPKYYRVMDSAPALRGTAIHHSRVMVRHIGVRIPYQQQLTENLWGVSVLERMYDRMVAYDSASTGAAQLIYKSYLRTLSIEGLREIVAQGGAAMTGLTTYVDMMRRFQGIEGITLIDMKDKFEAQTHSALSGMESIMTQLGEQVAGALQVPLTRLLGKSPGGMGSNGESETRTYYDSIRQRQRRELQTGVALTYRMAAATMGVHLPPNFKVDFRPLWELSDTDKASIANQHHTAISGAYDSGLISQKVALQEYRASGRTTGVFTNITTELIDQADDEIKPPEPEGMPGLPGAEGAMNGNEAGPQGEAGEMDQGASGGIKLRAQPQSPRPAGGGDRQGARTRRSVE